MVKQNTKKVGIYARLSKEDTRERAGTQVLRESVSIENQKLMLVKHVQEMGWELREIYQDDGFSGTNQNRPAFRRMIADVESGYINTILIKDLSRLGRNYLEVGNLAEVFLPDHNCELISLSEKLDDMMVFRNWFNEQHSKSTSNKVRASRRICAENGKYMGAYAPYGYIKSPDNRHKLIPNLNTAPIVQRIFEMRAVGTGYRAIAARLNNDGIISPREYYYQSKSCKNPWKTNRLWTETTIKDMIKSEVYIGNLVQGKSGTISYKNPKQINKPKDEWIRVEGALEPLIDLELWNRVQALSRKKHKSRQRNDGEINLFTGLLYCSDCGFKLRGQTERRKRKDGSVAVRVSYMCGTYAHSGKNACTIHSVSETVLNDLILTQIRTHASMVELNGERIIEAIIIAQSNETLSYRAAYQSELESHEKQIEKLDLLIENLYEDKVSGLIPASLFKRQIMKYEQDRTACQQSIETLKQRIESVKLNTGNASNWSEIIKKYTLLETLTPEILFLLIDKIIIGEAEIVEGKRVCDVKIIYNYVGNFENVT
ncbi:MAG: recombinase family protein [Oscillospiraceae bacterium]|nr:recombinase family protein [Oscillospiraceae bacterium]